MCAHVYDVALGGNTTWEMWLLVSDWLVGHPWHIVLNVGQESLSVGRLWLHWMAAFVLGAPWLQGPWGLCLTGLIANMELVTYITAK